MRIATGGSFPDKGAARRHVWQRMEAEGAAAPPLPVHDRIPNFRGSAEAALSLFALPPWRDARRIKVNPDTAQSPVRAEALRRGISVYVATPRLAGGFKLLDPGEIPAASIDAAADRSGWDRWARDVPLETLPQMDAIVCGSVAVTRDGRRAGKGAGYSDLEFAILIELGHRPVPVATTVHDTQIVDSFPVEAFDQWLAAIATPTQTWPIESQARPPAGIDWSRLDPAALEAMPPLRALSAARASAACRRPPQPSPSG